MLNADQVSRATRCPLGNVAEIWPLVLRALADQGIDSENTQIAAAATIATETPKFLPIRELLASPDRQPALAASQARYFPFYGRGLVQITWRDNYVAAGQALGLDLVNHPELALEPEAAAKILVWFFRIHGVNKVADQAEWRMVRRLVNGGVNGLEAFLDFVTALQAEVASV